MYQPGVRQLSGITDDITSIISAGAQAYKTVTAPNYSPFTVAPYQGPSIDPRTGAFVPYPGYVAPSSNLTVPLLIGGGLLLVLMMGRRRT
jgi:hypothetical protein